MHMSIVDFYQGLYNEQQSIAVRALNTAEHMLNYFGPDNEGAQRQHAFMCNKFIKANMYEKLRNAAIILIGEEQSTMQTLYDVYVRKNLDNVTLAVKVPNGNPGPVNAERVHTAVSIDEANAQITKLGVTAIPRC